MLSASEDKLVTGPNGHQKRRGEKKTLNKLTTTVCTVETKPESCLWAL